LRFFIFHFQILAASFLKTKTFSIWHLRFFIFHFQILAASFLKTERDHKGLPLWNKTFSIWHYLAFEIFHFSFSDSRCVVLKDGSRSQRLAAVEQDIFHLAFEIFHFHFQILAESFLKTERDHKGLPLW